MSTHQTPKTQNSALGPKLCKTSDRADRVQYDAQVARQGTGWVWATFSAAVPVAGSFGAAQLFAWAGRDTSGLQGWLFASGAVAITAAVGVTIASTVVEQRRGTSTARAKRNQLVKLRDELMPLASTTADMARQPLAVRQAHFRAVSATAAAALRSVVGEHVSRPRAVVYLLNADNGTVSMDSIGHSGRGERPRTFEAGTPRGDAALDFISAKQKSFYPDLTKKKPAGYDGTMSGYETYISVPIWTDTGVYGMVTLDAPKADSFDEGDVALNSLQR